MMIAKIKSTHNVQFGLYENDKHTQPTQEETNKQKVEINKSGRTFFFLLVVKGCQYTNDSIEMR